MTRRTSFLRTEDELRNRAFELHAEFHQAVATLVDHWIAEDRPPAGQRFGSFNAWHDLVGGILVAIGRTGLRGNAGASSPYQHAKAAWLNFLVDRLTPKGGRAKTKAGTWTDADKDILEVEANKVEVMLRREKKIAQSLLDRLLTCAARGEGGAYDLLARNLERADVRLTSSLSKVMLQVLDFDGATDEDDVTWRGKRVEGDGDHPLRYRFTTTTKRLDFRGGRR